MSTLKTSAIQDLSGGTAVDIPNAAKAWANCNGIGTVSIYASYNISSLTDLGTGAFQLNFTNAFPDTNYAGVIGPDSGTTTAQLLWMRYRADQVRTTTTARLDCLNAAGSGVDSNRFSCAIFR